MASNAIPAEIQWRKSSYSGDQGGDCVEIAEMPATIAVRDSKKTTGPVLTFRPAAFSTFVDWTTTATAAE
ncbi:DUF397 domain-containing protein [Streptomyces sp. GESEQ-35]|uniref:DUF397 domain-containing protein n=1 Tax=Streptomyces sp. GESEQ-35 TaxID=2812657 RepID=UPI001B31C68C|nr:DUF397 domain-containing protein [Streptomyces sp. GESEQ-35]